MVVKIRFGQGPVVTRRKGKNSRIATLIASLLTIGSISFASLGVWRLGTDLGWAGDFFILNGLLSHWQVWLGIAAAVQYSAWRLTRYARVTIPVDAEPLLAGQQPPATEVRATANV